MRDLVYSSFRLEVTRRRRSEREEVEEEAKEEEKEGRGLLGVPWVSVSVRLYTCIRGAKEYMLYCG